MLDEWGAADRSHRETARWLAEQQSLQPLAWNVQAIAASYERARGLREPGEKEDGYSITASKTVAVPVERLFDAVVDASLRAGWLASGDEAEQMKNYWRALGGAEGRAGAMSTIGDVSTIGVPGHRPGSSARVSR
jgi:hypothetical protein